MVKTAANRFPTRPARTGSPPDRATAMTPRMGSPTALTARPVKAQDTAVPAESPRTGGKMRFPAPKNMENRVMPTKSWSLRDSLRIRTTSISAEKTA